MAPLLAVRLLRLAGTVIVTAVDRSSCALLLAVRYVVFPSLDDYRDDDRRQAHDASSDSRSRSTSIAGGWDGWNPRLSITRIRDPRSRSVPVRRRCCSCRRSTSSSRGPRSLSLDLRLKELSIERPELSIRRDKAGRLPRRGLRDRSGRRHATTRASPTGCCASARSSCATRSSCGTTNLRNAPQLVLDHVDVQARAVASGGMRFGLVGLAARGAGVAARPARRSHGRVVQGLARREGAASTCASTTPTSRCGANGSRVLKPVESGEGALRVWFDFAGGKATDVVADLELTGVRTRVAPQPAAARPDAPRRPRHVEERRRQARVRHPGPHVPCAERRRSWRPSP